MPEPFSGGLPLVNKPLSMASIERMKQESTAFWANARQDWKSDAVNVMNIVQQGQGAVIEAPNKTGKSTLLLPEFVQMATEQGYIVALTQSATSDIEYVRSTVLFDFARVPIFDTKRGVFNTDELRVARSDLDERLQATSSLIAENKGKAIYIVDEATRFFEGEIEAGSLAMSKVLAFLHDNDVIPVFVCAEPTKKGRESFSKIITDEASRNGIQVQRYQMQRLHIDPAHIKKYLVALGAQPDLVDFMTNEENRALQTPGIIGRLISPMQLKGLNSVSQLRSYFENHWEDLMKYGTFGGSLQDMLTVMANLQPYGNGNAIIDEYWMDRLEEYD